MISSVMLNDSANRRVNSSAFSSGTGKHHEFEMTPNKTQSDINTIAKDGQEEAAFSRVSLKVHDKNAQDLSMVKDPNYHSLSMH